MTIYKGETVADGVAMGTVYLQGYKATEGFYHRIASDQVEEELNRLREAFKKSRQQIEKLKDKHQENLGANELRIFDVHLGYLLDSKFINEIETQIMDERLGARASVHKVVENYSRILQLVESDFVRQRAVDFRDVATRVQRCLEDEDTDLAPAASKPKGRYILAARALSTADMFNLDNEKVEGIVAEEGGISSHAAILARSMGIPTITGIRDLPSKLESGAFAILDASSGELHVNPDERLRSDYANAVQRAGKVTLPGTDRDHVTRDGKEIAITAACGSVGEANLARTLGMDGVGLYRTELMFLVEGRSPSEDLLTHHLEEVFRGQRDQPVNIRLLDVSSQSRVIHLPPSVERNPALGMRGIRALLHDGNILRRQIRAILRAAAGVENVGVLVPFVTGVSDLQRVKAVILEERLELQKQSVKCADQLKVAPIIEVPAAAFVLHAFLLESDFAVVALDDLQAYLLAADRDNANVRDVYSAAHPAQFELLARMAKDANRAKKDLVLFGEAAADPVRMPFYIGIGAKSFAIAPVRLNGMLNVLRRYTVGECRGIADQILNAPRAMDVQRILVQLGS